MRVGASTRQHARIKKMHKEGVPPEIIARTIQMTEQSLEKILAHLEGRDEKTLALENDPEVNKMRIENAELAARLAKYEDPQNGEATISTEEASEEATEEKSDPET